MTVQVIRLEGLPFKVSQNEVEEFFSEAEVKAKHIHLLVNRDQRSSGVGYVEFESESDLKQALTLDGKCIGDSRRYVKMIKAESEELDWQLHRQDLYHSNDDSLRFYCVRLYGVPYRIAEYEIAKWFLPVAKCVEVQIHLNHEGRPSGDASAYFENLEDANNALAKDKETMNGRYINLSMDNVPVSFSKSVASPNAIRLSGLPFRATEEEIRNFFQPEVTCTSVRVILNRDGRPSGDAIADFETEEDVEKALLKDREHLGNRFIVLTREKDVVPKERGARRGHPRNGSNNFCVKMSGLPYRASESEIIEWFQPEAHCIGVQILKNRDNRPSGEAIAEFEVLEEAKNALEKNRQRLGERYVILSPQGFR